MPLNVYYAGAPELWHAYRDPLRALCRKAGLDAVIGNAAPDPAAVDYIVYAPAGPVADLSPFTRCKAVLSLWAGVEKMVANPTLTQPLCRMVDPGLTEGMVEYVTAHVLRHHLGLDVHVRRTDPVWRHDLMPPLARDRTVAVLGLGALGSAAASALAGLNFRVMGWSREQKAVPGIACRSGSDGLAECLSEASITVLLLPQTADTLHLIDRDRIALMPKGAVLINPGRGPLIDDAALLAALDTGHVGHATLDVFTTEPLPADHPYWRHPRVTVTPHIAADTRAATAATVIVENIRRGEAGEPFLYLVDRARGY